MLLKLIILGLLCEGDRHPYEVLQTMKERQMQNYIKINFGTLYYNFEQLLKKGAIEVREVIHEEKRPDKTIYRITDKGRQRFRELLQKQLFADTKLYHPLYPPLMFLRFADPVMVRDAMLQQRQHTVERIAHIKQVMAEFDCDAVWTPLQIMKNGLMHSETELEWIDGFLQEMEERGM
ncbi:MAG TPA: PadR family transcriptional regulator [Bacilli bacterium]|nr:PadR family transcriptional regulator [Bacilli bacterium]